jgi:hypothetical protein
MKIICLIASVACTWQAFAVKVTTNDEATSNKLVPAESTQTHRSDLLQVSQAISQTQKESIDELLGLLKSKQAESGDMLSVMEPMYEALLLMRKEGQSPELIQLVNSLMQTMDNSLAPSIVNATAALQANLLGSFNQPYDACDRQLASAQANTNFISAFQVANATHVACRANESQLQLNVVAYAGTLSDMTALQTSTCASAVNLSKVPSQPCAMLNGENYGNYTLRMMQGLTAATNLWNTTQQWCSSNNSAVTSFTQQYNNVNATWAARKSICDGNQDTMDRASCDVFLNSQTVCQSYATCYNQSNYNNNISIANAQSSLASLRTQLATVLQVKCLLTVFGSNNNNAGCSNTDTFLSQAAQNLTLTIPALKQPQDCALAANTAGTQTYVQTQYSTLPSNARAKTCTAQCCPKCSTFTCPSGFVTTNPSMANLIFGSSVAECCQAAPTTTTTTAPTWTVLYTAGNTYTPSTQLTKVAFNAAVQSSTGIVRRECSSCSDARLKDVYYRRNEGLSTWDAYEQLMVTWVSDGYKTKWNLFSTLSDAQAGTNAWAFCNGDDPAIGFPRDCGPTSAIGGMWNSLTRGGQSSYRFSVLRR